MRLLLGAVIALVMAAPAHAATDISPLSLTFPEQEVGTLSAMKSIRVAHFNQWGYNYDSVQHQLHGADPEDFLVTRRGCDADGSYIAGSCVELRVRFAPGVTGTRSAKLRIQNWMDGTVVTVPLTGTGVAAKPGQGPQGPQGAPGAPGAKGPQGPRGREAKVTCKVKKAKGTKRIRVTCTTKRAKAARVRLVQRGRVLSSTVRRSRGGRVTASFTVRRGSYMVTVGNTAVRVRG